ncbi:hypothetical protein ACP3V5_17085 [Vibrio maritimus]
MKTMLLNSVVRIARLQGLAKILDLSQVAASFIGETDTKRLDGFSHAQQLVEKSLATIEEDDSVEAQQIAIEWLDAAYGELESASKCAAEGQSLRSMLVHRQCEVILTAITKLLIAWRHDLLNARVEL